LDISNNKLLKELDCASNKINNLDVSKNSKLKELYVSDNNFSALALNSLFETLPMCREKYCDLKIEGNPATKSCDRSIYKEKKWNTRWDLRWE
jgi:Leucine-rich repeat (LRR) protein